MKKIFIVCLILIVILLAWLSLYKNKASQKNILSLSPTPTSASPNTDLLYCLPQDLHTTLMLDHAAGNVYGTFTIKNISSKKCEIAGNNYPTANYNIQTIKNISLEDVGKTETQHFQLSPDQTLYSQVHYPNGPQCSSGIQTAKVTFAYAISPVNTITFTDEQGNKEQEVTACKSSTEITIIQVWNISSQPIMK